MTDSQSRLSQLVREARFEVMPTPGIVDVVLEQLPTSVGLTVTCSQKRGPAHTTATAAALLDRGYDVITHLAARSVGGKRELRELVETIHAAGGRHVFAIGGDQPVPAGPYGDALALIGALRELDPGLTIGVAGYPEGHPSISDERLAEALREKASFATYVTTQMCFDAAAISAWIAALPATGVELPVFVGVPGPLNPVRLLDVSRRIGVGQSLRFVRKNGSLVRRLLKAPTASPDALLRDLAAVAERESIGGLHVFTFNELGPTMRWREGHAVPAASLDQ